MEEPPLNVVWNVLRRLSSRDVNQLIVNRYWLDNVRRFREHEYEDLIEFTSSNQLQKYLDARMEAVPTTASKVILHFPYYHYYDLLSRLMNRLTTLNQVIMADSLGSNPYPPSRAIIKTPTSSYFQYIDYWYRNNVITRVNEVRDRRRQFKVLHYSLGLNDNSAPERYTIKWLDGAGRTRNNDNPFLSEYDGSGVVRFRNMTLDFPTFHFLTDLSLSLKKYGFYSMDYDFGMDERILITIHNGCPELVNLTLIDYFMTVSKFDFDVVPSGCVAHKLRSLSITGAIFNDYAFFFLSKMYSLINSFSFTYSYRWMNLYDARHLQEGFCWMLGRFDYLTKLSVNSISYDHDNSKIYPFSSFIQLLNDQPERFTYLDYPVSLIMVGDHPDYDNSVRANGDWLNHVNKLKMRSKELLKLVTNFIVYYNHPDSVVISTSITELTIYDDREENGSEIFLLDWLLMFPFLKVLRLDKQTLIDATGIPDLCHNTDLSCLYMDNEDSKVLHYLLQERKELPNTDYKKNELYNLEALELSNSLIKYVAGLSDLFIHFTRLDRLILRHIRCAFIGWYESHLLPNIKHIALNVPHLSFDYVFITDLRLQHWQHDSFHWAKLITRVNLVEYATGEKRNLYFDAPSTENNDEYNALCRYLRYPPYITYTLRLKCKHVERLVYF